MTRRQIRVHPEVIERDLREAITYYRDIDESLPERLVADFGASLRRIEAHPTLAGEYLPGWRRVLLHPFPYVVVFAVGEARIHVVGFFHARRDRNAVADLISDRRVNA